MWKNKYEALAKLYSQLRQEHLELINKFKAAQLKANSAQEAIDKMERMERDMRAKNLELADMIRERDRSRHELDRLKSVNIFISFNILPTGHHHLNSFGLICNKVFYDILGIIICDKYFSIEKIIRFRIKISKPNDEIEVQLEYRDFSKL